MWFGNLQHAQEVPTPATGMTRNQKGYSTELEFENGGLWIEDSAASHAVYPMEFPVQDASAYEGLEAFVRFKSGEYGRGYLYFVDQMFADTNLFAPHWASPALIDEGWKNFGGNTPTFTATAANAFGKPAKTATWTIDSAANAVFGRQFTILIPPGHTLHLGGSGAVTGTGALSVIPILKNYVPSTTVDLALSAATAAPAFTSTFDGNTYGAVRVHMRRTSTAASTVALTALWAQVRPTGVAPVLTRHMPGRGSTGLKFQGDVIPETYVMAGNHLVGMSIALAEVEDYE